MAVRTITTKLALDGEAEYKRQIKSINAEYGVFRSEIQKLEAQFKGQLNTLDALSQKEAALSGQQGLLAERFSAQTEMLKRAKDAYAAQSRAVAELGQQLAALNVSAKGGAEEQKKLQERLEKAKDKLQMAANSVTYYQKELNYTSRDQANLNRLLAETVKYMGEAKNSADRTATSIDGYGKEVRETVKEMEGASSAASGLGGAMRTFSGALKSAGAAVALREIGAAFKACTDASMAFETAMAGVNKVAKMSDSELAGMETAIKQLSTSMPATTTEIAQVVEASLRLGIAKESVMGFAATMLDLGNVSDLSSEAAATALARFANIAGTAAEDYGRLGSTIVALGNNFATSESEITNMASRLASAGTLAGLTEAQIMGLSAALSSVGIEAEAGGTAMTQTLAAMEKAVTSGGAKLEQFARIAGMSSQSFSEAWKNDPVTAIQAFIGGLGRLDEQGESATLVLDELGLSGVRQSNMLKSLALAYKTLDAAMATANQAWAENTELSATAGEMYDTAESKAIKFENAINNLRIEIGDMFVPVLNQMAEAGTKAISWMVDLDETKMGPVSQALASASRSRHEQANSILNLEQATEAYTAAAEEEAAVAEQLAASTEEVAEGTKNVGEATREATQAVEEAQAQFDAVQARTEELTKGTLELSGAQDTLAKALKEQTEAGSLSVKTAMSLIDAGYGAALAIDQETGAVTLNKDRYVELASAKINDQIASLETQRQAQITAAKVTAEAMAAQGGGRAYYEMAAAKLYAEQSDTSAIDVQIANLERLRDNLGNVSAEVVSTSKRAKTQAELDLEAYKQIKAELDHSKAVNLVDEREYFRQLAEARDRYLTDEANVSEYRRITEQIYKYDKSLVEREIDLWEEQSEKLIDQLEDRADAVRAEQDKMEDKLSGYGELFTVKNDRMSLENLQKQIDAVDDYAAALEGLRTRGVSESLLDEVLAMDVDSATQYAKALLSKSDQEWDRYNALWDEKQVRAAQVAEQFFKDQMEALETEYTDKLGSALDALTDTSFESGVDTAQGLIDGLSSMEEELYKKARTMAAQVSAILAGAEGIPSNAELAASMSTERISEPSTGVTRQDLRDTMSATVNGIQTATAGAGAGDLNIILRVNGKDFYTETIEDFRSVDRANPEVMDDK